MAGTALIAALAALAAAVPAAASAAPGGAAQLVPLAMEIPDEPIPVRGADSRNHLAYEIEIANRSPVAVDLESVQPLARGRPFGPGLAGEQVAGRLRIDGGDGGTTIPGGAGATLFADATYPGRRQAPKALSHRFAIAYEQSGEEATQVFDGVSTRVDRQRPLVVRPPLRGERWVAANGCCGLNAHRGATLSIDGTAHTPERFAIDFVQLNAEDRLFTGANELANYGYFGAPIRSATAGMVVRVKDGLPEQAPGELPAGATIQNAGGNHVVVRVDRDHFAFYAHLQPGSPRVEVGDRVEAGDRIGLLGNSGNTDGPHLHFHIMDSPSPLESNGLPFTFTRFHGQGRAGDVDGLETGGTATVDPGYLPGPHRRELQLENQIVRFPGGGS